MNGDGLGFKCGLSGFQNGAYLARDQRIAPSHATNSKAHTKPLPKLSLGNSIIPALATALANRSEA
jgi:hypothetical protein